MKQHFSRFFAAGPGRLHFAAHSHHPWPDVSFEAHQHAWLDAARYADQKWDVIYGSVIPEVQGHIANTLSLPSPDSIVFAPNTHELFVRIRSCLPDKLRILTTDSEFHSFSRQVARWEEAGQVEVVRIAAEPFDSFGERFANAALQGFHDLVYLSQVFFNSGFATTDLTSVVNAIPSDDTFIVIDGYHGFRALPTDLSAISKRAFYIAGGYKYAMSGEGVCFAHCPPSYGARPVNTGWFAGLSDLDSEQSGVPYPSDANRFAGSTIDVSGIYRMAAVLEWLESSGLTVDCVLDRVRALQQQFYDGLPRAGHSVVSQDNLMPSWDADRGHFLTFRTDSAGDVHNALMARGVITDFRNDRLRFGFGMYQDPEDVTSLLGHLGEIR